jgi:hypothetical protein
MDGIWRRRCLGTLIACFLPHRQSLAAVAILAAAHYGTVVLREDVDDIEMAVAAAAANEAELLLRLGVRAAAPVDRVRNG